MSDTVLVLTVEPLACHIEVAVTDARRLACQLGVVIGFDFNGIYVCVSATSDPHSVVSSYEHRFRHPVQNYPTSRIPHSYIRRVVAWLREFPTWPT